MKTEPKVQERILLLGILLLASYIAYPQELSLNKMIQITGEVISETGEILPGVNIYDDGRNAGTVTDQDGSYSLWVMDTIQHLNFSMIGFESKRIKTGESTVINVRLTPDLVGISEVVIIGYGTQNRQDLTGAVSSINKKNFHLQPVTSIEQVIQGRTAGVSVSQSSGAPGGDVKIRIRGANSIFGNNNPLIVIDGVIDADLNSISTNDIQSIDILKDASSTAIYGSRGANGVVLVTTKSGIEGATRINFNTFQSISELPKQVDYLSALDFVNLYNIYDSTLRYVPGFPYTPAFSDEELEYYENNEGTDWQDELFRMSRTQNYELSVQGGDQKTKYYVSGGYLDQQGILINSDYYRYSLNSKISTNLSEKIHFKANISASHQYGHNNQEVGSQYSPIGRLPQWVATEPVWDASGDYYNYSPEHGAVTGNPVGLQMTQNSYATTNSFLPNGSVKYSIFPGLEIEASGAVEYKNIAGNYLNNNEILLGPNGQSTAGASNHNSIRTQYSIITTFQREIKKHYIQLTGIIEESNFRQEGHYANAVNLHSYTFGYHNLALSESQQASSYYYDESLKSFAFRTNYNFSRKYFMTATMRLDGSSKFKDDNKYGLFPSVALGWRLSEENFIKNLNIFSNLKVRASYGVTGSQAVGSYATLANFIQNSSVDYVVGGPEGANITGLGIGSPGNPYLRWESTAQTNIGIEMGFLKGRLNMEFDLYRKMTSDLLLNYQLPYYAGNATIISNIGMVLNRGMDVVLNATPVNRTNFTWQVDGNFSLNRNSVVDLGEENQIFPGSNYADASATLTIIREGESLGTFYGYKYSGVWKSEEIEEAALYGNKPGDAKYEDLNNDSIINTSDLQIIGYAQPDFVYGLNNTFRYKNLSVNIFIQGVKGGDIFNGMAQKSAGLFGQSKAFTSPELFNRWSPENEDTDIPAFSGTSALYPGSSRWLEDASYLRVKNITVSYDLTSLLQHKLNITRLQVYVSAMNLLTITKYSGYDPEVSSAGNTLGGGSHTDVDQNIDTGAYPNPKSYTIGLKVTF